MPLVRRRKSTGAKVPALRSQAVPQPTASPRPSVSAVSPTRSPTSSPRVLHKIPSAATVRPSLPLKASSGPVPTISTLEASSPDDLTPTPTPHITPPSTHHTTTHDPKFSTADRTILQELRRNMSARAAQFVIKGGPAENTLMQMGVRHHAYDREEVPYPRSYAREVLDLDVWETMACQRICDSLTWHVFPTPPTKILSTGTGTWILNCGMAWPVPSNLLLGMDIVPLHPNLGASGLATRITWVQANFLEGLPFEADEFDYVHIKRIALGVPEDKWDRLFEEIVRVLKPGGAFELIEEDLFFPGKTADDESDSDSDVASDMLFGAIPATPPRTPPRELKKTPSTRHSFQGRTSGPLRLNTTSTASLHGPGSSTAARVKPRGYSTSTLVPSLNNHTPAPWTPPTQSTGAGTAKPSIAPFLLRSLPKPPPNPRDHSLLEGIYNEMNATRFINLSPLSLLANLVGLYFKDVRTHPPLQLTFPPPLAKPPIEELTEDETDSDDARDAIIPSPRRRQSMTSKTSSNVPGSPRSATFSDDSTLSDEQRYVNMHDLIKRESRYVLIDDARMSAFSPSNRSSFPALSPVRHISGLPALESSVLHPEGQTNGKAAARPVPALKNRLPNATFNIDVRSLNMHLALRTAEILGCSEAMWEWVKSYQARVQAERAAGRPRTGSLATEMTPGSSRPPLAKNNPAADAFKTTVLNLTREDFDGLLVKFEMDMRDHMAIGSALHEQFAWPCMSLAPSQDRKVFVAACERWDQWKTQQRRKVKTSFERHQRRRSIDTVGQYDHDSDHRSSLPETRSERSTASSIPPERRLSRSIRVFAAWKP
ncbi:hypothetical protein FB45DRAFT_735765 [Roridomyces roridus]|uniref:Methyltransferase domain-containing protein n=1 Tax=Roridomyces roridus TaxID=1738132 RepID=A0AAD7CB53_9AGAR|nr:hypothetical protein FB45DRAFT_735765 [Roridomyces roridus]